MLKTLVIVFGMVTLMTGCKNILPDERRGDSPYQRDMDIIRMRDIQNIAGLIEEYRQITGHYPLVKNSMIPQYVYIATDEQKKQIIGGPAEKHVVTSCETLERELDRVLKRHISLPKDPQRLAVNKPNFYLYITRGKNIWLAVNLHSPCSLSKPVTKFYHTVEVSSKPWPQDKLWSLDTLTTHPDFIKEANRPLHNPGAIRKLRETTDY